jgi:hypothetical protein
MPYGTLRRISADCALCETAKHKTRLYPVIL